MLLKTIIEFFQTHKHLEIEWSPGLNVIVGESNSGKSSIIRALDFNINNRKPANFRSWYAKSKDVVSVENIFDNGSVKRVFGTGTNWYILDGDDDHPLEGFGQSVPKQVQELINLDEYSLRSQRPKDQYFLLDDSSGEVARKFNDIAGLDIIDLAQSNAKSFVSTSKEEIGELELDIERLKGDLAQYDGLDEIGKLISEIEQLEGEISHSTERKEEIDQVTSSISDLSKEMEEIKGWLDIEPSVFSIADKIKELEPVRIRKEKIQSLTEEISKVQSEISKMSSVVSHEDNATFLHKEVSALEFISTRNILVSKLMDEVSEIEKNCFQSQKEIDRLKNELESKFREAGVCPLCFTPVSEEVMKTIMGKY